MTNPNQPKKIFDDHAVRNHRMLMSSPLRRAATTADLAPQAPRAGSLTNKQYPSRIGDQLHYADGRITDLNGQLVRRKS